MGRLSAWDEPLPLKEQPACPPIRFEFAVAFERL
jgi:hypothetical protein